MADKGSPENETGGADDQFAIALAGGATIRAAAKLAQMSERTAHRRLKDSAFQARLAEIRERMIDRAVGYLARGAASASKAMLNLLQAENAPAIVLRAAEGILDRVGLPGKECPRCRRHDEESYEQATRETRQVETSSLEATLNRLTVDELKLFMAMSDKLQAPGH